jgi:hypothetical protein
MNTDFNNRSTKNKNLTERTTAKAHVTSKTGAFRVTPFRNLKFLKRDYLTN